ncbi:hypothetical protein C7475_101879 [Chitinophaga sp. S165]|nr:hypothetical protein C7475_101879 [Chitinophaga sp. S165]
MNSSDPKYTRDNFMVLTSEDERVTRSRNIITTLKLEVATGPRLIYMIKLIYLLLKPIALYL